MSDIFALDSTGNDNVAQLARENPLDPGQIHPGFWSNAPKATGMGVMRGGARAVQAGGVILTGLAQRLNELQGGAPDAADPLFKAVDDFATNAVDYWTPDAHTTGAAGRVIGGFAEMALPLMVSGGNPAPLLATTQMGGSVDLTNQGVDPTTAVGAGALQTAATAAGFKVPFLGKTLATRMGSGALGNLLTNTGSTVATEELLRRRGFEDLAKNYNAADFEARMVDVLAGITFGGLHHLGAPGPRVSDAQREAVATAVNAWHYQEATAPGHPADIEAQVAHQDAMDTATLQLLRGEQVNVPEAVTHATFEPRERAPDPTLPLELTDLDTTRELEAKDMQSPVPFADTLSGRDRVIERRMARDVSGNFEDAAARYAALEDSQGGKVLNTDTARELSTDYLADRTKSAAVHEPASWFVKKLYAQKLSEAPKEGELPEVLFTAGGTGAGKTTAVKGALGEAVDRAQIIYDTNMNGLESSLKKIDQALAAGKTAQIIYVYRDPIEALKEGALSRAARQEKEHGSGRTVPIDEHIATHTGSRQVIEQIAAHYAGDARVRVRIVDNSRGRGKQELVSLGQIPKPSTEAHTALREQAVKTVEEEHAAGRVSDAVRSGFLGAAGSEQPRGPGERQASGPDRAGDGQQPTQGDGAKPELTFAVKPARAIAAGMKGLVTTGEVNPDGSLVQMSAQQLLERGDAEIGKAQQDAKGIEAAVSCFLQRGAT